GKKVFLLLLGTVGLAGVVVALLTLMRSTPKPLFMSIAVTEYDNYPPNPFGQQDGSALRDTFGGDAVKAFQAQERTKIRDELHYWADRTAEAEDKGRPMVVHLTALAVAREGTVRLLPGKASPDSTDSWLPLADVLAALRKGQGQRLLLL